MTAACWHWQSIVLQHAVPSDADPMARGQVLDVARGVLYPPVNLHSAYTKGYWQDCNVADAELAGWLASAKLKPAPPLDIS